MDTRETREVRCPKCGARVRVERVKDREGLRGVCPRCLSKLYVCPYCGAVFLDRFGFSGHLKGCKRSSSNDAFTDSLAEELASLVSAESVELAKSVVHRITAQIDGENRRKSTVLLRLLTVILAFQFEILKQCRSASQIDDENRRKSTADKAWIKLGKAVSFLEDNPWLEVLGCRGRE